MGDIQLYNFLFYLPLPSSRGLINACEMPAMILIFLTAQPLLIVAVHLARSQLYGAKM